MATATSKTDRTPLRRAIGSSVIGNTIEFYDFFLYGSAAALVFNQLFFPESDPAVGTLLAFATYAVGFVARPIGALVFGHLGDTRGRKAALVWSLLLMGGATFVIGLLPTYAQIGVAAPLLLVLIRLIQGFAFGGEWGGAILIVAEHASTRRRAFWTSWPQIGGPAGNLLSVAVLAILSVALTDEQFLAWGWRIPFLLSAGLTVVGLWIRLRVTESPVFQESARIVGEAGNRRMPALEAVRRHPRQILAAMFARFAENASYYIFTIFLMTYVTQTLDMSRDVAMQAVLIASAVEMVTIPLWGLAADRVGRRPIYLFGAIAVGLWAFAFFPLLDTQSGWALTLAVVIGLQGHAAMTGALAAMFSELFTTEVRYSGISIGYQFASVFAGSLAPIIAIWLFSTYGSSVPIALYLCVMSAISVLGVYLAGETRGVDLSNIKPKGKSTSDPLTSDSALIKN